MEVLFQLEWRWKTFMWHFNVSSLQSSCCKILILVFHIFRVCQLFHDTLLYSWSINHCTFYISQTQCKLIRNIVKMVRFWHARSHLVWRAISKFIVTRGVWVDSFLFYPVAYKTIGFYVRSSDLLSLKRYDVDGSIVIVTCAVTCIAHIIFLKLIFLIHLYF